MTSSPRFVLPFVCALALAARAEPGPSVPLYVPVEGRLLDGNDQPVNGQTTLTFAIYDVAETPAGQQPTPPVWTATYDLSLTNGLYDAMLGDISTGQPAMPATLFDGTAPRWLGVSVNHGAELTPRLRIGSVPHAFLAQRALEADHATEADLSLEADHATEADHASAATDATTVGGEDPASLHDASKLTGTAPASVLGSGSTNVTTVGDVTQGSWSATPVDDAHVASAATWNAKLDHVAHDATLAGDGKATPLSVVYGTGANTAAAGNDPRFSALDGKFASYLPLAGGAVSGDFSVSGDTTSNGISRGVFLASNRSFVGLEHDILLDAPANYTVTETGPAPLDLPSLFDGAYAPSYSDVAPTPDSPEVIEIDGLPGVHVQAGAVIGWTTRYWPASRFKLEIYDTYLNRNAWRTLADYSSKDYSGSDFAVRFDDAVVTNIRLTVYAATGDSGRLGIAELFFLHDEVSAPYANLIPKTETYFAYLTNGAALASANGGTMAYSNVQQNTNAGVFQAQPDGSLKVLRAGTVSATASADCISNATYCSLSVLLNGNAVMRTLSPYSNGNWAQVTATFTYRVSAGDVLGFSANSVASMDNAPWSTLNVSWTGLE